MQVMNAPGEPRVYQQDNHSENTGFPNNNICSSPAWHELGVPIHLLMSSPQSPVNCSYFTSEETDAHSLGSRAWESITWQGEGTVSMGQQSCSWLRKVSPVLGKTGETGRFSREQWA